MKKLIFIIIFFVFIFDFAIGQIIMKQGEKIEYTKKLEQKINSKIEFDLSIDNNTLIYIDSIKVNGTKLKITRKNYILHCNNDIMQSENIELSLFCTALFGNDTLTYIKFNNVKIDETEINFEPIEVNIETQHNFFYSRFGKITRIYPAPASRLSGFNIEFVIDILCDVNIYITNEVGEKLSELVYLSRPKGIYTIPVTTKDFPLGVYYVYIVTNTGTNVYTIIIRD